MTTSKTLMTAAIAGILSVGTMGLAHNASAAKAEKGQCMGANACKGKGGCKQEAANDCAGKNACKGKGFVEMNKAKCDKLVKKNKATSFKAI